MTRVPVRRARGLARCWGWRPVSPRWSWRPARTSRRPLGPRPRAPRATRRPACCAPGTARRARAYARGDAAALRRLYVAGSRTGARRRAPCCAAYVDRGLRVTGMRTQVLGVRRASSAADTADGRGSPTGCAGAGGARPGTAGGRCRATGRPRAGWCCVRATGEWRVAEAYAVDRAVHGRFRARRARRRRRGPGTRSRRRAPGRDVDRAEHLGGHPAGARPDRERRHAEQRRAVHGAGQRLGELGVGRGRGRAEVDRAAERGVARRGGRGRRPSRAARSSGSTAGRRRAGRRGRA